MLYQKKVTFMLAYPAVLHVTLADGEVQSYTDPQEAETLLENLEQTDDQPQTPIQNRTPKNTPRINRSTYYTPRRPRMRYR